MKENFSLEMNKRIYSELNDAVHFVNLDGAMIWSNTAASSLLNLDGSQVKHRLDDYFDIDLLMEKPHRHLLMRQKNNKRLLVDVKRIELDEHMFCLILKKVSLKDHTVEIKKHIDQLVRVSTEGLVMRSEERRVGKDC